MHFAAAPDITYDFVNDFYICSSTGCRGVAFMQNGAVWRIQLGPFASKSQASTVQQRLQNEAQLQSFITRANLKEVFMVRTTASVMKLKKVPYYNKCISQRHPTLHMTLLMIFTYAVARDAAGTTAPAKRSAAAIIYYSRQLNATPRHPVLLHM
jgi:hypothetical protein